eukprot:GHVN01083410.1.p1 GENE.GHVN01083410.1~~GHVN01083410.1.p1  ORF type:complete len:196 (+),score=25.38 GHVN01083410.1:141-728(+)
MVMFDPQQLMSLEMRSFMGQYLSTGNPMLDMIVGFLIFKFIMHASQSANNFSPAPFFSWLSSLLFSSPQHKGQLEFSVEGQVNNFGGRSTTFTPTYKAIMYRVSKIEDDRIWHLRERNLQYYDSQLSTEVNESVYEVMQREPIEVDPGIFVQCEEAQEERPSPNGSGTLVIAVSKIVVFSDTQSAKALKEVIQKW